MGLVLSFVLSASLISPDLARVSWRLLEAVFCKGSQAKICCKTLGGNCQINTAGVKMGE